MSIEDNSIFMSIEDNSIFMSIEDNSIFMSTENNSLFPNDSSSFPNKTLTFEINPLFVDPFVGGNEVPETKPDGIWETLLETIRAQVKKDGIDPKSIQPGQIESEVFEDAVSHIYHDVVEFYDWYFNPDDDRAFYIIGQKFVKIPPMLREKVFATVEDNLDAIREVDEIPSGQDTDGLNDRITNGLSRYILNWRDWYYDRKREEEIDSYFEQKGFFDEIYLEDEYGDLTNLLDSEQYDGISDVPYIAEEL